MRTFLLLSLPLRLIASTVSQEAGNEPEEWKWKRVHHGDNNGSYQGCFKACQHLHQSSKIVVIFANTTAYELQKADYWSTFQSDVAPACFVEPSCAEDVGDIVRVAHHTKCRFAVKSGGHAAFTGASNIPGGMTILLNRLNELSVSEDRKTTRVGTGNVWIDVYDYLTPKNLSVVGGRGGLTLGGGISFFSGRYGWACDNIVNYELVTASSKIIQVNHTSHPSLYFALRGGGNNFGIVTRLDMSTFPQGQIWGGSTTTPSSTFPALFDALYAYAHRAPEDIDAALYTAFAYVPAQQAYFANTHLTQARGLPSPPIFQNFTSLRPSLTNTLRLTNLTDLARELNQSNPNGLRESYQTHNFRLGKNDQHILSEIYDIFHEEVETIKTVEGILPVLLYQPLTTNVMQHFSKNGGNALGLSALDDGPLLLMSLSTWWTDTSQDERVLGTIRRIVERAVERSRQTGADHPYMYQNYAAAWQDVFAGYGEQNLQKLRTISKKWDPQGIFSRKDGLQPGYFKLFD